MAEFSFHARSFCEGVPGVRQAKVTKQGGEKAMIDAPERVCIHALASTQPARPLIRAPTPTLRTSAVPALRSS